MDNADDGGPEQAMPPGLGHDPGAAGGLQMAAESERTESERTRSRVTVDDAGAVTGFTIDNPGPTPSFNMFEGRPDARQAHDVNHKVSRFRPTYRALTAEEKELHDAIKDQAALLEQIFDRVGPGRYHSLAITALEQAVMWIVKELTATHPGYPWANPRPQGGSGGLAPGNVAAAGTPSGEKRE